MRKLLMALFLLGTISVFCDAQIDGYVVRDGFESELFTEDQPRTYAEIGIKAGESVVVRFSEPTTGNFSWERIDGNWTPDSPRGLGRISWIKTGSGRIGDHATYRITDDFGDVLILAIFVY